MQQPGSSQTAASGCAALAEVMRLSIYVRAATAWALSASSSKEAGISPATTPGSHSAMVVSTASPPLSAVKLMSSSAPA